MAKNKAPIYSVNDAKDFADKLRSQGKKHAPTNRYIKESRVAASEIELLADVKRALEKGESLGDQIKKLDMARLNDGMDFKGIKIDANTTLEGFKEAVDFQLNQKIDDAKDSKFLKAIKESKVEKKAAKKAELAEKEGEKGFASRLGKRFGEAFEKHQKKLAKMSSGERLGISVAEVGLGFVGINIGTGMLQQASQGVKREKVFAEDNDGNRVLAGMNAVPLSGGERTLKAVVGTGLTAAGITSFLLGAMNFGRSPEH